MSAGDYVLLKLLPDDPFYAMASSQGIIREHRLVMARHLNRPLMTKEVVHHINGVRDDNRIENLQLLDVSTHGRIHVKDALIQRRENARKLTDALAKAVVKHKPIPAPLPLPSLLSVEEASEYTGISRRKAYMCIKSGEWPEEALTKIGKVTKVKRQWLDRQYGVKE